MNSAQIASKPCGDTSLSSRAAIIRYLTAVLIALLGVNAPSLVAQANTGELRLKVTDPSGLAVKASVRLQNEASEYDNTLKTDDSGQLDAKRLPFGTYQVEIRLLGFAPYTQSVDVRSELPTDVKIALQVASVSAQVTVSASNTLIDPDQAGSVNQIGTSAIENRLSSLPGRSIQDLVNSQPGWLYEGNAVLHPRGSEYQTQFVVDGIPLTDNRSPSFGPELEADDVDSISIYTAGIPAEYGRKMGGVVEINTTQDTTPGFHGEAMLSGGSFDTTGAFFKGQELWGKNTFGFSASGAGTAHYLNPVVTQNFTNRGTTGDFSADYERDFTPDNRLTMSVRHEFSRYELPNEAVQEAAGQLQTADNFETMGIISFQHIFSSQAVADIHAMVRDNSNDFYSNASSTPVLLTQHDRFREGYVRGTLTLNHGRSEWKAGFESDNMFLNENTKYVVSDASQFDDSTPCQSGSIDDPVDDGPCTFQFIGHRPDLEQAAFLQDLYHFGNWTINAGVRWDHYQLLLNRQAVDPRFAISRYFPKAGIGLHFSYDRVFQTPSFENILYSSSPEVTALSSDFLRLPVEPSEGNYYEVGLTKSFGRNLRFDGNYFRRLVSNYADDDQIDNTTISFPIAFRKAILYGAEAKLDLVDWKRFSGYLSYSYIVGNAWNPVTGGLFLGADADAAESEVSGHFPDSQDQRNTVRGRLRFQVAPRLWVAGGIQYDTGLPFEFQCDPSLTLQQCIANEAQIYGQDVVDRINFNRGRILPSFQVNASVGADIYKSEHVKVHFQADGQNLNDVVDVIDFGGLFSGNAIGPSRSFTLRLQTDF
jgi:Carboxypeptidase regulatory-like domain/TonB-dependent Receptor Plug Domain